MAKFLPHGRNIQFTIYNNYYSCRWHSDVRSQGNSSHGGDLVLSEYATSAPMGIMILKDSIRVCRSWYLLEITILFVPWFPSQFPITIYCPKLFIHKRINHARTEKCPSLESLHHISFGLLSKSIYPQTNQSCSHREMPLPGITTSYLLRWKQWRIRHEGIEIRGPFC